MWSFILSIVALVVGYFTYGKFIDKYFGADPKRKTPATELADNVDYQEIKPWKIYIIQFLNIAGLGPIFGAILGAAYGLMAYVWIVIGCIFMGAVHDYLAGMLSLRNYGMGLPDIIGKYLGNGMKYFMTIFTGILLLAVGVSFVNGPAGLLGSTMSWGVDVWLYIIFAYYLLATLLPINKIIGAVYPLMGLALIFMSVGVCAMLFYGYFAGNLNLPEFSLHALSNLHAEPSKNLLFPMLFVLISCGAMSGFHATQSPLMARCMSNEKYGRPIFYGAMITEGIVTMIWATAAIAYCGGIEALNASGKSPAILVNEICSSWLGRAGAIIAIIGVVACPITTGDTAFRSMRLIIADAFKYSQHTIIRRLVISIPIFAVAYFLSQIEFKVLWNYVGISNQVLASITLWTCSVYLYKEGKCYWITTIPAIFITWVCATYFLIAPNISGGLNLDHKWSYIMGALVALAVFVFAMVRKSKLDAVHTKNKVIYAMLIGLCVIGFILYPKSLPTENLDQEMLVSEDSTEVSKIAYKYGLPIEEYDVLYGTVERGQTISSILLRNGLTSNQVSSFVECAKGTLDVKSLKIGQAYACLRQPDTTDLNPKLEYFVYEDNDDGYVLFDLRNEKSYSVKRGFYPVEWREKSASGVIESSLWNAMKRSGADSQIAIELSQIFGWSIDFFGLQKNDSFTVIYDQKYVEGDPLNRYSIRAARMTSNGKTVNAIPFMQDGEVLYFDETGNSLEGAFLKAPLDYYRISSKFSNSRFHPVLKRYRAHHGVDYAAPAGTPVYAIGSGKIIEKGYQANGGGNYIKIRHNGTYTTTYMHLQKFANGVKVGKQVAQKEVIGYVGSTGLATGPHLDFRVFENGTPINPLTIKSQPKAPVKAEFRSDFDVLRDTIMMQLDRVEAHNEI